MGDANIENRWPEAMSYSTVAWYIDLDNKGNPASAKRTVARLIKSGEFPAVRIGKFKRVLRDDLDAYLGRREQ